MTTTSKNQQTVETHAHLYGPSGMMLDHVTGQAYYWRRCVVCQHMEYRGQNTPLARPDGAR